jgi:hypothetical protein
MLIGLFGLAVTLAASVWLRARELATLAALGFDRAMLARAVVFEGALIAAIGLALGLASGIAVGAILTHVVNPQAFHWRMPLRCAVVAGAADRPGDAGRRHARQPLRRAPGHAPAGGAGAGRGAVVALPTCAAAPSCSAPCCCPPWRGRAQPARHAPARRGTPWPSRATTAAMPNSAPSGGTSPARSTRRKRDIGFQLTFFRSPQRQRRSLDSPLAPRQILFAHAAVTRPGQRLLHTERAGRAGLGAGFSTDDCDVHIGAWLMRAARRRAGEHFQLRALDASFAFDLRLTPTQPLLLQGENGWSQKGPRPELASHYVSWPQLRSRAD